MSNATLIDDRDRDDEADDSSAGLGRRLARIDRVLKRAHAAIDRINAASANPPDDNLPTLESIKRECEAIRGVADQIIRKMSS